MERQSRNTGPPNRNLYPILKLSKQSKTPGTTLKNIAFSERRQLFAGDFHAALDKINADML